MYQEIFQERASKDNKHKKIGECLSQNTIFKREGKIGRFIKLILQNFLQEQFKYQSLKYHILFPNYPSCFVSLSNFYQCDTFICV